MGLVLVAGAPCAGKTTYVRGKANGAPVLDFDSLFTELYDQPPYAPRSPQAVELVEQEFRQRLDSMRSGFVIRCSPRKQHRAIFRRVYHATSIVLATPLDVCLARLDADSSRGAVREAQRQAIQRWWAEYEPSSSTDERVVNEH